MDQLEKLYDVLVRDGHYTKSFEEFKGRFENEDYQQKVFDVVSREGLFTKDVNEFKSKYVGKQQGVTPTGASVTSTSTSFASDDIVLASPEEAFNIEEPKAYKSILESQQVTDEDLTKISTKRSEELGISLNSNVMLES
jgi:hypothetical protein